ncbi:villin-2-like [Dioscorea cayenensis subsp. rotundata]|uniref:Villin-2-like n=1 Tax=Dioscorea cayennensis subsp. rotundata TaxID=55577 RepID=A0AB40BHU4_DIOCR|nr:villin-2-like [Dioscorea cayenensis subsp. rotundata]
MGYHVSRSEAFDHIICEGFLKGFVRWIFHGESSGAYTSTSRSNEEEEDLHHDMHTLLNDAFGMDVDMEERTDEPDDVNRRTLGLGYKKVHACPNDCMLFWKNKEHEDICSKCGASRWKEHANIVDDDSSISSKKKKPVKILHWSTPIPPSASDILRQLEALDSIEDGPWKKKSILFSQPYWEHLCLRHNLDVMHIEKNVSDNILGTLIGQAGKSKDNIKIGTSTSVVRLIEQGSTIITDHVKCLARGPEEVVRRYTSYLINGYRNEADDDGVDVTQEMENEEVQDELVDERDGEDHSINNGQLKLEEGTLSKEMLKNNKCYLLDCGSEIFIWVGRATQLEDRKATSRAAEEFTINQSRPKMTRITQVIQGFETHSFKSNFESWSASTVTASGEEGRGKVAALLKQQRVDMKGMTKGSPLNEEVPPLLEAGGKLEVWCINGSAKTPLPMEEIGKFYGGDCYIIHYTYHSGEKKEEYFLSSWLGKDSIQDDQIMSVQLTNAMFTSLKGRPTLGRIIQGKEPPQFIALFQPMVVLKGGVSSGYKMSILEKNLNDDTYSSDGIALLQIFGTSSHNNKALQVDAVATSLNPFNFFVLQSGNSVFCWQGNSSSIEQRQWATNVVEFLKPGATLKHAKEGTESSAFWFALGGKHSYTSKKVSQDIVRDPHLYSFSYNKGKFKVDEVFNFSQDDLLSEDILILDTHVEVFVWVGYSVHSEDKQNAFEFGQKYIELAADLQGLSPDVPLYKVIEGHEPSFSTTFFSWDTTKVMALGNSFQKRLSLLFGPAVHVSESRDKFGKLSDGGPTQRASALAALSSTFNPSSGSMQPIERSNYQNHSGPTQRASALAALSFAFNPSSVVKTTSPRPYQPSPGSQRAAAVAALSTVLTAEQNVGLSECFGSRISQTSSLDADLDGKVIPIFTLSWLYIHNFKVCNFIVFFFSF